MIAVQPVYWRISRIYRKRSFLYCYVLDHVYRAVAWQCIDHIRYNMIYVLYSYVFNQNFVLEVGGTIILFLKLYLISGM
jgi:hypothetical protein